MHSDGNRPPEYLCPSKTPAMREAISGHQRHSEAIRVPLSFEDACERRKLSLLSSSLEQRVRLVLCLATHLMREAIRCNQASSVVLTLATHLMSEAIRCNRASSVALTLASKA